MSVLNQSHVTALYNARQILRNFSNANPNSLAREARTLQLVKLKEINDCLRTLVNEPMFDELQNLDTGGPPPVRSRLEARLCSIGMHMLDGNPTT